MVAAGLRPARCRLPGGAGLPRPDRTRRVQVERPTGRTTWTRRARSGGLRCAIAEPPAGLPEAPRSRASSPGRRRPDPGRRAGGPTRRRQGNPSDRSATRTTPWSRRSFCI